MHVASKMQIPKILLKIANPKEYIFFLLQLAFCLRKRKKKDWLEAKAKVIFCSLNLQMQYISCMAKIIFLRRCTFLCSGLEELN